MPAPARIAELVATFERNLDGYRSGKYNETQVRREFIDPLFAALGWDVDNTAGYAEPYKDVIHEDAIKVGGATEAPDYCFRIGGTRKFFVEAKKPSIDIESAIHPAFQLRRYAWSAKLLLSILTDFDEFAVYDCRVKPVKTDAAATARTMFLRFTEYVARWDELAGIFSRDAVLKGSFDKYAGSTRAKKGTAEVDDAFLADIESWRDLLAHNLALRNPRLSTRELNFAVQRTIDRIIFLRICEDRGVEPYGVLQGLLNGAEVYPRLVERFHRADERYNSGLFHFQPERDRAEAPDELTLDLAIDDKVLKDILRSLYYPDSPYEFSVLSADILGQVYEQFLGKVIRMTAGHQAKVEDKPEVKKAGGVYYTPTYIVDYIVTHTVGQLLEGQTPKQAAKLRILDPACGSGSFLIGAYQRLLDWHRDWYIADGPAKWAAGRSPALFQAQGGDWRLTTGERKRILLNNIYGVDIDPQAVEVTKLSLLLKVLEGQNDQTLSAQLRLFHERALPDLGRNIKCGNSLIGPDFYKDQQLNLLGDEERFRINVFEWKAEFGEIMESGGFDAVIGNPPYVLLQTLDQPAVFDYLAMRFRSAKYKIDTYQVFMERGLGLCSQKGLLGYITPNTFLRNVHARELRRLILEEGEVQTIRLFYFPVFRSASVDTCITVIRRTKTPSGAHEVQVVRYSSPSETVSVGFQKQSLWSAHAEFHFALPGSEGSAAILAKVKRGSIPLGEFATAYFGIQTWDRQKYVARSPQDPHAQPVVDGANVRRYSLLPPSEYVRFHPDAIKSGGNQAVYEQTRIGVRQIGSWPVATIISKGIYSLNTIYNVFFTKTTAYSLAFVLGIVCSRVTRWFWQNEFFDEKRTFPKVKKAALLGVRIPTIDFHNARGEAQHAKVSGLVESILTLNRQMLVAKTDHEQTGLARQIDATDRQIDELVYALYGLTAEEIRIVEDATRG